MKTRDDNDRKRCFSNEMKITVFRQTFQRLINAIEFNNLPDILFDVFRNCNASCSDDSDILSKPCQNHTHLSLFISIWNSQIWFPRKWISICQICWPQCIQRMQNYSTTKMTFYVNWIINLIKRWFRIYTIYTQYQMDTKCRNERTQNETSSFV